MRFLYQKEFVAQREASPAAAVAELYRRRGLSTDTAVEAGYVVHLGLGVLKALEPTRRVRRVLIVGPGPRPGAAHRPATNRRRPRAISPGPCMDAVLSLGLGTPGDLEIVAADINPRVVAHLARAREHPPRLRVASSLHEARRCRCRPSTATTSIASAARCRRRPRRPRAISATASAARRSRLRAAARALRAEPLDIVTQRLDGERFDLIIATNILPYFDDPQLALAMANIASMLAPGGVFPAQRAAPDHRRADRVRWGCRCSSRATPSSPP